jgi:hypothetical protein
VIAVEASAFGSSSVVLKCLITASEIEGAVVTLASTTGSSMVI